MSEFVAIGLAWRRVRDRFREAGIETPDIDARILAQRAFDFTPIQLVSREREPAPETGLARLEYYALARLDGQPVARLLGEREFWGRTFILNPATLVPRPETEVLVAEGLARLQGSHKARILDLGTGSGAVVVSLLADITDAMAVATDMSDEALAGARANAERYQVARRISFIKGDWYDALDPADRFDLIVSNPPYIASAVIPTLRREVKDHDPLLALDGGMDGLQAYRVIIGQGARWLKPGGALAVEVGSTQGQVVAKMMDRAGFEAVELLQDIQGLDRVVSGTHP